MYSEISRPEAQVAEVDRPLIWVEKGSLEYQLFLQRLNENIYEKTNKKFVCVGCWSFISQTERVAHPEHKDLVFNAYCIKDEQSFLQLAVDYGKIRNSKVAILNNKCIFAEGALGVEEASSQYSVVAAQTEQPKNDLKQQIQVIEQQKQQVAFSYKQALQDPLHNPLLTFGNDIYEDAGSNIDETLRKARKAQHLSMRRSFFSPSILGAQLHKEGDGPRPDFILQDQTGPFAILGKEDNLGFKLGDATADDILYLAKRTKRIREQVKELKEIVDMVFDVQYCGRDIREVGEKYKQDQEIKKQKIKEHMELKERQRQREKEIRKNDQAQKERQRMKI